MTPLSSPGSAAPAKGLVCVTALFLLVTTLQTLVLAQGGRRLRQACAAPQSLDPIEDVARRVKIYGVAKPSTGTLSRFYGDQRVEDEALRNHLLNLKADEPTDVAPAIRIPAAIPKWFSQLVQSDREIRQLWSGRGKPEHADTTGSGYDYSLTRQLLRRGHTDLEDLAAIVAHRPNGCVQQQGKGDAYICRTIANALTRKISSVRLTSWLLLATGAISAL